MEICINFDGTCVTHEFPNVGKDIGAIPVLKKLIERGHNLILFTMRSNVIDVTLPGLSGKFTGMFLDEAVKWFEENEIPLYGVNTNPDQKYWTNSSKAYAQLYIDDAALSCPLKIDRTISNKPFVDWVAIEEILIQDGIL
jgi:hypothetical protein